jgi:catechol 2,3-dioxygenase-like lactoylglutathione lyase family enzyme
VNHVKLVCLLLTITPCAAPAQPAGRSTSDGAAPVTRGIFNWVHTTGDAESAFEFYNDVFGIELAPHPFIDGASAPEGIRPEAEAGSDALVRELTNTAGSRFRTVFMRASNTPFGLELSEFFDIPRRTRAANPWDPGASMLRFDVRDLDEILTRLDYAEAPIVTLGGRPLTTRFGRAILIRDPDGYLIELVQAAPGAIASAAAGEIVRTSIVITVSDTDAALAFYEDLLGFEIGPTDRIENEDIRLYGLAGGALLRTAATIPFTDATVLFSEFVLPVNADQRADPFDWRIQDVGAPQFQLEVAALDALLERSQRRGYRFLSVGGRPIQRPFGRFVFVIDADGVLVEFVERAAP